VRPWRGCPTLVSPSPTWTAPSSRVWRFSPSPRDVQPRCRQIAGMRSWTDRFEASGQANSRFMTDEGIREYSMALTPTQRGCVRRKRRQTLASSVAAG
jgi:hypothetical protein